MPPVVLWDHLQDPLDVDKKKTKLEYAREADPNGTIQETEGEQYPDSQTSAAKQDQNRQLESSLVEIRDIDRVSLDQQEANETDENNNMYITQSAEQRQTYDPAILKERIQGQEDFKFRHAVTSKDLGEIFAATNRNLDMIKSGTLSPKDARATFTLITSPAEIQQESPEVKQKKTNPRELFQIKESLEYVSIGDLKAQFEEQHRNISNDLANLKNPNYIKQQQVNTNGTSPDASRNTGQSRLQNEHNLVQKQDTQPTYYSQSIISQEEHLNTVLGLNELNDLQLQQIKQILNQKQDLVDWQNKQKQQSIDDEEQELQRKLEQIQIRKIKMQNVQQEQMMNTNKINPKDFDSQQQFYKSNGPAQNQGIIRQISGAQYYVPPSQLANHSRTQSFKVPPLSKQLTQNPAMSNKLKLNHQMTFNAKRQTLPNKQQQDATGMEIVTDYHEQPSTTIFIQQKQDSLEKALVSENLAFFDRAQDQGETKRINTRRASKQTEKMTHQEPASDRQKMSATQQVFQSLKAGHGLNVGGALARDSSGHNDQSQNGKSGLRNQEQPDDVKSNAYLSVGSNLSPGVKKLGGIARRKFARQSTRQQAEFKRTFSVRDSSGLFQPNQRSRDNSKGSKREESNENIKDIQNVVKSQEQLQEKMISKMSSKVMVDNQINRLQASFVNSQEPGTQFVAPNDPAIKQSPQQSQQFEMQRMMESQNIISPSQRKVDSEEAKISEESTPLPANVMATQTDMDNNKLKLKIRRSKKSFQGQVYLENSNDFLKSQLRSLQANTITSRKLSTQTTNVKLREMQQLEEEKQKLMKESYDRKQQEIAENLKMIQQLEKELAEAKQPKPAQAMAVQTSSRTLPQSKQTSQAQLKRGMANASSTAYVENPKNELNPLLMSLQKSEDNTQQLKDQANDPKTRDQNTNAMARDMATDPMICEKATDPRTQDIATDAWKRDGVMQTSHKSHINTSVINSLQNKQVIASIRNSNVSIDAEFDKNQQRITQSNQTQKEKDKENNSRSKNNGSTQYNLDQGINDADIMESKQKLNKSTDDQIISKTKIAGGQEELSKSLREGINKTNLDSQNSGLDGLKLESPLSPEKQRPTINSPSNLDQNTEDQATRSRQDAVDRTPIYHDHLLEEVMNQKVINLRNLQIKSRDQQRNDSRSTQQMFENQFAVRGKNKFKQKRNTQFSSANNTPLQPNGQLQIINQSINQNNLPPINGGKDQNQYNHGMNNMNAIAEQSNNYDAFITPKAYNGHQQQPTMLRNHHSHINQHLPPNQPIQAFNMMHHQMPLDPSMNQMSPSSHQRTKDNCLECAERRAKRKQQKQFQTLDQRNNQMELSQDRINGLPNPSHSPQQLMGQISYGQNGFGSRNNSLPPVINNGQIPQQNQQYNQQQQFVDYNQNQNSYRNLNQNNMMMDPNMLQQQNQYHTHNTSGLNSNRNLHVGQQNYNFANPSTGRLQNDGQYPQTNFTNSIESSLPQIPMNQQQIPMHILEQQQQGKPTYGFMKPENNKSSHPLKHFKGQDLEMYYMEKQLKPEVEKEIKKGFFEIRKKFGKDEIPDAKLVQTARGGKLTQKNKDDEEVQVYVSHICLHDFHPIFCKMNMETVKIVLQFSSIVYLNKGQTLFAPGFNDQFFYIILFGRCKLNNQSTGQQFGQQMNIGWTVGEEILFKAELSPGKDASGKKTKIQRKEICKAVADSCFLGIEKRNLTQIKKSLFERSLQEEFTKIEIVLRGNHMVKKDWK